MKLGLVGSGMIVVTLLEIINQVPDFELHSLYARNQELGQKLCETHKISNYFNDYDAMLDSDVEVVYIGIPNHLHYQFAKKALEQGKNVIVEKSFTLKLDDAIELRDLALQKHLYLFEAITNIHLAPFDRIKTIINDLGAIKIVNCNISKISSRYAQFKEGITLPAFDATKGGGALFDLNVYNIHFVVGLLDKPERVSYFPNIERDVDTSGILILEYPDFKVSCTASKDTNGPVMSTIQGELGYLKITGSVSTLRDNVVCLNDGTTITIPDHGVHRMIPEFQAFAKIISAGDYDSMNALLDHTLNVVAVLEEAKQSAKLFQSS